MEPKIRFKGISGEWETRHVGELCDVLTGFPFEGSKILSKGKELLMRGINITEGYIRHSDDIDRYFDEDASSLSKYRLQKNDLVIGMDGSKVGKNSALVTDKEVNSLLVQRVARLRNDNPHLIHIIQIALGSGRFFEYVDSMKTSSAIPHISPSDIKNFTVSISANDDEIKLVSDYFQHLDSLIQSTTKKIESLKQVKAASLQSMFPQEGETTPRVRFKGFDGEWEKVSFDTVFTFLKNNSYSRDQLSESEGEVKNVHYGDVLIKFGDVIDVNSDRLPYVIGLSRKNKHSLSFSLCDGDIIIADAAEDNTVGKCSEINNIGNKCVVAGLHTIPCRPMMKFAFGYLGHYINSNSYHNQLLPLIQGSKISSISKSVLKLTSVTFPSFEEQQKIADYFTNLDSQITLQSQRLEKLKQIKSASLDNMFV